MKKKDKTEKKGQKEEKGRKKEILKKQWKVMTEGHREGEVQKTGKEIYK